MTSNLQELTSFLQQKGFIWGPEPELYGGLSGFYTYAPLGKLLKNRVEQVIRNRFTQDDFFEVECPTIMPKAVWEASGHLGGFSDPVISCGKCKANFRADNLIKEFVPGVTDNELMGNDNKLRIIREKKIVCPVCKGNLVPEIKTHSLMMRTTIGLDIEAYNRPETATTTYLPFIRYHDFFRKKYPFGVFQIGKAYRNEISPRQHVLRQREFTQAEGQLFIFKDQKNNFEKFDNVKDRKLPLWSSQLQAQNKDPEHISLADALSKGYLKNQAYAWSLFLAYDLFVHMGIPEDRIRMRQHHPDEKAFYADDAWDVEIKLNTFGWFEMCGVHDRTDYDLKQHGKAAGKDLAVQKEETSKDKEIPHIIEIAFGSDRPTFAVLDIFYDKKADGEGKTILHLPVQLAPVHVAVLPLLNKDGLPELARQVSLDLKKIPGLISKYDSTASIGKRYLREAEAGTPFCVTIDHQSKEDGTVTLRERDSEAQKRIKISHLSQVLSDLAIGKRKFSEIDAS